jgi:hypothetical protein
METPRDGYEEGREDELRVDGVWGQDVGEVALVDAEASEEKRRDGGERVQGRRHVLAKSEYNGRRVVPGPLGVHAHDATASAAGRASRRHRDTRATHSAHLGGGPHGRDGDAQGRDESHCGSASAG